MTPRQNARELILQRTEWVSRAIIAISLNWFAGGCDSAPRVPAVPHTSSAPTSSKIPYSVVKEWSIPNGGHGKVILIDSLQRNEEALRALGETLRQDTRSDHNAFIFVYDDSASAAMHSKVGDLSESDWTYYSKHNVGSYIRNGNTGYHKFEVSTGGSVRSEIIVNY